MNEIFSAWCQPTFSVEQEISIAQLNFSPVWI